VAKDPLLLLLLLLQLLLQVQQRSKQAQQTILPHSVLQTTCLNSSCHQRRP
jgi:hypothetical protein